MNSSNNTNDSNIGKANPRRNKKGASKSFPRRTNPDGSENTQYSDVLNVDKPIAGQNYMCISFLSPDKILKQKEIFFFEEFLKKWEYTKSMEKFIQFLNFVSYKNNMSFEDLTEDFKKFVKEESETLRNSNLSDDYKTFLDHNEEELQKKFDTQHNFQTNVRGIKVRGSFPTEEEARMRCKLLRENDPMHDIYVGPVGTWVPWEPEAYKTGDVQYLEEELNQLMHEKEKSEQSAKTAFDQRVRDAKEKAIEENIKHAEKSGNVLTQTIDKDGNLVGVANTTNTLEASLGASEAVSTADIAAELFDGDNIITGKTDNGQSLLKSGPFATNNKNGKA